VKLLRKIILTFIMVAVLSLVAGWWFLLSTICSSPTAENPATENTISCNCHGSVVFITPVQDLLLHWLIPVWILLALSGNLVRKWKPS
jgi:hypothetical protein